VVWGKKGKTFFKGWSTSQNVDLTEWLVQYNSKRLHQSLDYKTPLEYATWKFKVSPMWASSTSFGVLCINMIWFFSL